MTEKKKYGPSYRGYTGETLFDSKLEDVKRELKYIDDIEELEKLISEEKKHFDRPGFYRTVNNRIDEIKEHQRIIREGLIDINMFDILVNKILWCRHDMEKENYNKELREAVYKRDNYTCQLCKGNSKNEKLACHHIIPNGPVTMENLITLCYFCHDKIHLFLSKKGYRYAKKRW